MNRILKKEFSGCIRDKENRERGGKVSGEMTEERGRGKRRRCEWMRGDRYGFGQLVFIRVARHPF